MNFKEFEKEYTKLFEGQKFQEAIDYTVRAKDVLTKEEYEENLFSILRDRAILYYYKEDFTKALETFDEVINNGYSLPGNLISILPIKDNLNYQDLIKRNEKLIKKAQEAATLKYKVCLPKDYDKSKQYPVFFNVHGDGMDGNIKDQMNSWPPEPLLEQGYIVVYPQSSQTYCTNGHGWMKDKELSRKEIKICYDEISEGYSVDKNNIILGGFSGGADAVVDFTMYQVFPVRGFISLCPTKFVKSFTNDQIINAKDKGIKGCIFEGEKDLADNVKELVGEMETLGFKCQYIINKGIGHSFPSDLKEKVNKVLDFIYQ